MSYVIATPSFAGDFERCRLLAESVQRFIGIDHYVLIDEIDESQFACLRELGVKLVSSRQLMGNDYLRLPFTRLWVGSHLRPLRGWITQQIRKLAFAAQAPSEDILFVDSDIVFVRPFQPSTYTIDSRTPLFITDWYNAESLAWANQARTLLALPSKNSSRGYVHPTFWKRDVTQMLLKAIEEQAGRSWRAVITALPTVSEYTLYGIFAQERVGLDCLGLYDFNQPIIHHSWQYDLSSESKLKEFIATTPKDAYGLMFHSKDRVPVANYVKEVRAMWASSS